MAYESWASRLRPAGFAILSIPHGSPPAYDFIRMDESWASRMAPRGLRIRGDRARLPPASGFLRNSVASRPRMTSPGRTNPRDPAWRAAGVGSLGDERVRRQK